MSIIQVPEGYRIIAERKIGSGIDECQIEASHAAFRKAHQFPVEFITTEEVDPICGSPLPGRDGFYEVLHSSHVMAVAWIGANRAELYCGGTHISPNPFLVLNYNYQAGKGDAFVLEKITEYDGLFKSGLPPKAQLLKGQMLEVVFGQDINRDTLAQALRYNGYRIFSLPGSNENLLLEPKHSSIADFGGLVYYSGGWYKRLPDDLDVIKAGTCILVDTRT